MSITVIACMMLAACGGAEDGANDRRSGSGGGHHSGATGAGGGATTGSGSTYACCLNGVKYACPDEAAFDQCIGFDMDGCMNACALTDFNCQNACFEQLANATHDPSSCVENPAVDCGDSSSSASTSTSTSSVSTGGNCSAILSGCDYDDDCCSGNCTNNTCWGNSFGDPCEYDDDCNSNNCFDGTCQ